MIDYKNKEPFIKLTSLIIFGFIVFLLFSLFYELSQELDISFLQSGKLDNVCLLSIIISILVLFYYIIQLFNEKYNFINNMKNIDEFKDEITNIMHSQLSLTYRVECFHYKVSKSNSNTKVITYSKDVEFFYNFAKDISGELNLSFDDQSNVAFVKLSANVVCNDELTKKAKEDFVEALKVKYKGKDMYIDIKEKTCVDLINFNEYICIYNGVEIPKLLKLEYFVLFNYWLLLGGLYDIFLQDKISYTEYNIKKLISIDENENLIPNLDIAEGKSSNDYDPRVTLSINGKSESIVFDERKTGFKGRPNWANKSTLDIHQYKTKNFKKYEMSLVKEEDIKEENDLKVERLISSQL